MVDKKELFDCEPTIRTDAELNFNRGLALRHRREASLSVTETELTLTKTYQIDGARYIVNSIFPTVSKQTADDNIKHLITGDIDKVS